MTATRTILEKVVDVDAHEGPVHVEGERALYFTSLTHDVKRLDLVTHEVTTVLADANGANGMTLGRDGRLLVCEQGSFEQPARISALDPATGAAETVVDNWCGLALNSPNDIVVAADGAIWFTDPSYGYLQGFRPQPQTGDHVYRHDPSTGETAVVDDSFDKPNGLAFSPDGSILYVGDSGANHEPGSYDPYRPHHVIAFDVVDGRGLENPRLFCVTTPGFPDGLKVDGRGFVYTSAFDGVHIYTPDATLVRKLQLPGAVNFDFDEDDSTLFVTTDTAVWAADLTKGA
jgi:gluconolactonase